MKTKVLRTVIILLALIAFGLVSCTSDDASRTEELRDHPYKHLVYCNNNGTVLTYTHTFHTGQTETDSYQFGSSEQHFWELDNYSNPVFNFTITETSSIIQFEAFKQNEDGGYELYEGLNFFENLLPGNYTVIYDYNTQSYDMQ